MKPTALTCRHGNERFLEGDTRRCRECVDAEIAALLRRAATELGDESVMYSLGLHQDHAEAFDHEELVDSRGNKHLIEIPIPEEEAERRKQEDIDAHLAFVAQLNAAADLLS